MVSHHSLFTSSHSKCQNQDHEDDSDEDDEFITRQLHVTESRRNHGDFTTCQLME